MVWRRRCGANSRLKPVVDVGEDRVLAQADIQLVLDLVGQGVLGRKPAAVIRCAVRPVALHVPQTPHHRQPRKAARSMTGGCTMCSDQTHSSVSFHRSLVVWPSAMSSTSSSTSSLRCR